MEWQEVTAPHAASGAFADTSAHSIERTLADLCVAFGLPVFLLCLHTEAHNVRIPYTALPPILRRIFAMTGSFLHSACIFRGHICAFHTQNARRFLR